MPVVVLTAKDLTAEERAFLAERTLLVLARVRSRSAARLGAGGHRQAARDACARGRTSRSRAGVSLMPKILLVEDNEMNRDMLSRRLVRNGFEVVLAVDGGQGVAWPPPKSRT